MPFLKKVAEIKPKYIDENGIEREVDTTVVPSNRGGYAYENTTNSLKTFFKEKIAGYEPVLIETSKGFVAWQLFGAMYRDEYGNEEWIERVREDSIAEVEGDTVIYPDSIVGIDDEFVVQPGMLKHNTVIHKLPSYKGTLPGKEIVLAFEGRLDFPESFSVFADEEEKTTDFRTTGKIELRDSEGNVVFYMPEPTAYEESGEAETPCYYDVIMGDDFIRFLVEIPYDWLLQAQMPVVVDPTLIAVTTFAPVDNPRVVSFHPDGRHIFVGYRESAPASTPAFRVLKFDGDSLSLMQDVSIRASGSFTPAFAFHPSGNYIGVYDASDSTINDAYIVPFDPTTSRVSDDPIRFVSENPYNRGQVSFHPSGNFVAVGTFSGFRIYPFDPSLGEITELDVPFYTVGENSYGVSFSPDGKYIAATYSNGSSVFIYSFDQDTGVATRLYEIRIGGYGIRNRALCFWQSEYISVKGKALLRVDPESGVYEEVANLDSDVYNPIVHPSMKYALIKGSNTQDRKILSLISREYVLTIPEKTVSEAWSPDGKYLAWTIGSDIFVAEFVPPKGLVFGDSEGRIALEGRTLRSLNLGVITEDTYSSIREITVENHKEMPVTDLTIQVEGELYGDLVEFSKTLDPFVPETFLYYPETLDVGEGVTFYIRVKPHPDNTMPLRKIPISARAIYAL